MPIVVGSIPTPGTAFTGILGIDSKYREPEGVGLISEQFLQLGKAPPVQVGPMLLAPTVLTDSLQIFQGNRGIAGHGGELDNLLADTMIGIAGKPCLSSGQPLEHAPETPGVPLCLVPLQTCNFHSNQYTTL
jgi:hypothetical protein